MKMKLYSSKTSPFARKVRIAVEELSLQGLVEEITTDYMNAPQDFLAANPLSQIPVLVTEKGETLPGSNLAIDYLLTRGHSLASLPRGSKRFAALRRVTLADGITEAAVAVLLESRRPAESQYAPWMNRKREAVVRALAALEVEAAELDAEAPTVVEIAAGAALGYLDFRFADLQWRNSCPQLAAWFEAFSLRPSMQRTQPVAS